MKKRLKYIIMWFVCIVAVSASGAYFKGGSFIVSGHSTVFRDFILPLVMQFKETVTCPDVTCNSYVLLPYGLAN